MLVPFADDASSTSFGQLTIENGSDRLVLYGSLDITRDQKGLALAWQLRALLDQVVAVLEHEPALPAAVEAPVQARTVRNPFA